MSAPRRRDPIVPVDANTVDRILIDERQRASIYLDRAAGDIEESETTLRRARDSHAAASSRLADIDGELVERGINPSKVFTIREEGER